MICVSIAQPNLSKIEAILKRVTPYADLAEIRLDALSDFEADMKPLSAASPLPLLWTNRPEWEGGRFKGSEDERIEILKRAVRAGAAYVDIELATDPAARSSLVDDAKVKGTRVILSFHDLSGTPPMERLRAILEGMAEAGADVGKIVTTARDNRDVARLFALYEPAHELGLALTAFSMGEKGRLSRLACLAAGAPITYAAPFPGSETAPGQIPAEDLHEFVEYFSSTSQGAP